MVKVKTLRVRAVTGRLVRGMGAMRHDAQISYVGRAYDPKGDANDIEAEFPASGVVEVPNDSFYRKCVADGDLEVADAATSEACGLKPSPKAAPAPKPESK